MARWLREHPTTQWYLAVVVTIILFIQIVTLIKVSS